MKIVVCGGGTAGHITPVLAIIDALYALDSRVEILFVGSGSDVERKLIDKYSFDYQIISAGKFRRYGRGISKELADIKTSSKNITDMIRFSKGYLQAKKLLKKFKPDVVFTKGGYVTLPVGLAASRLHIPLIIHDSDAVLGMASRILASRAQTIATGFPAEAFNDFSQPNKLVFTGNPVRKELLTTSPSKAKTIFGFTDDKPIVFIFGGSQGAEAINDLVFEGLELLLRDYNVIHHTGPRAIEQARVLAHKLPFKLSGSYRPYEFLQSEMTDALFLSSLVVIRASASSIAEAAAHSKPTILIPNPISANNHQQANAKFLEKIGAARVIEQSQLSPIRLCAEIDKILSNPKAKKYLQDNIHEFWVPDSANRIASLIIKTAKVEQQ